MNTIFDSINNRQAELQRELKENSESLLKQHLAQLFEAVPELDAVQWAQYTPYFNDGDTCTFSVGEWRARWKGDDPEDSEYAEGFNDLPWRPEDANFKQVQDFEAAVPESVCLAAFGDHVEITVTREGFQVDEYSHD